MCQFISTEVKSPEGEGWREGDVQREAQIQRGTKRIVHSPSGHLKNEKFPSALKHLFCGFWQQHLFKLQFHCSTTIHVHIWILCMSQKSIHPFWSVLSLLSQTHHLPYKSAFQLSLAAVSKLCRKPKKRASPAPPSLVLAASG